METWRLITALISTHRSGAREELERVAGIAASLIADEAPTEAPIVVAGCGPRLRIYCLYGEDAIVDDNSDEAELAWNPTDGNWKMWLPSSSEDIDWVKATLAKHAERILAYDLDKKEAVGEAVEYAGPQSELSVNVEAFRKP
jgi:hypothetical protein